MNIEELRASADKWLEEFKELKQRISSPSPGGALEELEVHDPMREQARKWLETILQIRATLMWDQFHDFKRMGSFIWFDLLLDFCNFSCCPSIIIDPTILYALTDISLDGYILRKAYEFSEEKTGIDDQDRYYLAENRIRTVLNCPLKSNLSEEIFDTDTYEVFELKPDNYITFYGARNRKAYWIFLKNYHSWVAHKDCSEACEFIKKIHNTASKPKCNINDIRDIKALIEANFHIANPLDLYRLCLVKKKAG